ATASCCAFAATAGATSSPSAPKPDWTRPFTSWRSPRSAANGRTSATLQGFRADLSRSHPDRRAAAESGESQLGWISDFRQAGRPVSAGDRLDQSPTATAMNFVLQMKPAPTLVWFRHDLRLADNPALAAAIKRGGPVAPV